MPFAAVRNKTRQISIGRVKIGGFAPVSVQSMTNTMTQDVSATVAQIRKLTKAGCEIIRVAVPDREAASAISEIKKKISIPLIADIHFDFRLAIAAVEAGAGWTIGKNRSTNTAVSVASTEFMNAAELA